MSRALRLGFAVTASAVFLAAEAPVHSQADMRTRQIGVHFDGVSPGISFSVRDLLDARSREKLDSGLPQTLVLRVFAYSRRSSKPIAMVPLSCRVVHDLWDEVYRVQVTSPAGTRTIRVSSAAQVLEQCLVVHRLRVGSGTTFAALRGQSVYFAVLAEFNPVDPLVVERVRRWIARGGQGLEEDSFYGSFVSLFVQREVRAAERIVRFRSQPVTVPR